MDEDEIEQFISKLSFEQLEFVSGLVDKRISLKIETILNLPQQQYHSTLEEFKVSQSKLQIGQNKYQQYQQQQQKQQQQQQQNQSSQNIDNIMTLEKLINSNENLKSRMMQNEYHKKLIELKDNEILSLKNEIKLLKDLKFENSDQSTFKKL